jgi:hypothetical protein
MSNSLNNYHFVIPTSKSENEFREKSQIGFFIDKMNTVKGINYTVIFENKKGLPKVYNQLINEEKHKNEKLIFVHDDVIIDDLFWEEKLDIAFEKFDIVGLAGSKKCDLSRPPAWHLMSDRQDYVGEVAHSKDKVSWTTCFGSTNSRALVLDGLFLAVNVSRLLETKTEFDERFKFHHYDITFCLRANENKLKMGVAPIKVTHFGLGDSMNTPEWYQSAEKFKKFYVK